MRFETAIRWFIPNYEEYEENEEAGTVAFKVEDYDVSREQLRWLSRVLDAEKVTCNRWVHVYNAGACGSDDCCGSEQSVHRTRVHCEGVAFWPSARKAARDIVETTEEDD